jgi:hypothetical protein
MADILYRCPKSGKEISTGLKTEWVMFETLPGISMPLACAACGKTHKWRPKDGWIANESTSVPSGTDKNVDEIEQLRTENHDLRRQLMEARQQIDDTLKARDTMREDSADVLFWPRIFGE